MAEAVGQLEAGPAEPTRTDADPVPTLQSAPKVGQTVHHAGQSFLTIREGRAHILAPRTTAENAKADARGRNSCTGANQSATPPTDESIQAVFYNPIQQFNRDLSVLATKVFGNDLLARRTAKRFPPKKRRRSDEASKDGEQTESQTSTPEERELPKPPFTILDALSATGLRAMRYALEIPSATAITANDLSATATALIELNSQHNRVSDRVEAVTGNALRTMYSRLDAAEPSLSSKGPTKFDVIDLDPYGTAAPFIDAAVQSVSDGGMLAVTCTDSAVFAAAGYPEKTYALYNGVPTKGPYSHETALRLIISSIAQSAAKYGMAVEPLLSLSIDYYVRIFIQLRRSPAEVKFLAGKTMVVYACDSGCGAWATQPVGRNVLATGKNGAKYYKHTAALAPVGGAKCDHCGFKTHLAGPMWAGPLHNRHFVDRMLETVQAAGSELLDDGQAVYGTLPRLEGMLLNVRDELSVLPPFPPDDPTVKPAARPLKRPTSPPDDNDPLPSTFERSPIPELDPHPFYVFTPNLSRVLHAQSPPEAAFRGALKRAGFVVTRSHAKGGAIKTNAPWSAVWRIMSCWARTRAPPKEGALTEGMAGRTILERSKQKAEEEAEEKENKGAGAFEVVFDEELGQDTEVGKGRKKALKQLAKTNPEEAAKRVVRYQANPEANWGPMRRARAS